MSALFKSFSRIISQATLNSKNHTYIVSSQNAIQNPVLYYLNDNSPPKDLNELSLVAYHIVKKNELSKGLINQFDAEPNLGATALTSAYQNLVRTAEDNERVAEQYVDRISFLLKSGAGDLPVHNAIQALYAFEAVNKSDPALYNDHLLPIIKDKIAYASLSNLVDLANVLSHTKNFEDKSLWGSIVKQLEAKFDRPSPKYVKYHGWTLDSYELDATKGAKQKFSTEIQRYLTETRSGGNLSGNLRHEYRVALDKIKSIFLYRFMFNEARVTQTLDNFEEAIDSQKLRASLEAARGAGINVGSILERASK